MSEQVEETKEEVMKEITFEASKFMNADEYSPEELQTLAKLYDQSFQDLKEGEIIKGKIVGISDDNVVLDIGFKSDGTISQTTFIKVARYKARSRLRANDCLRMEGTTSPLIVFGACHLLPR